jgi:hypothetical protein
MQDVVSSRDARTNFEYLFSQLRKNPTVEKIDDLDKFVMVGDWGGWYETRRPYIQQLDDLRRRLNVHPPVRPPEMFTNSALRNTLLFQTNPEFFTST